MTQKGPVKCNICSWCFFLFFFLFFLSLLFSCCVKSTFLSTSTYDVFIFLAFFVIYLSITAAFQPLQVFSWKFLHSISLFSLYVLGDFLSPFLPLQYILLLPEGISSSFSFLFMSVFPVSSLPPLSPSYALSLTHYRHITCPTALSSWKSLQFSALIPPSPPPSGGEGELPPPARKSSRLCKERSITYDKPLQRCLPGQKQWSQTWIMSKSWLLWTLLWKGIGPWPWLKTGGDTGSGKSERLYTTPVPIPAGVKRIRGLTGDTKGLKVTLTFLKWESTLWLQLLGWIRSENQLNKMLDLICVNQAPWQINILVSSMYGSTCECVRMYKVFSSAINNSLCKQVT